MFPFKEINFIPKLKHPLETYGYIFIYSVVGYFGLDVVLTLVSDFGALLAVTGKKKAKILHFHSSTRKLFIVYKIVF